MSDPEDARPRLLDGEEQYRVLFESNPHPMWVFDVETLQFLAVNDAASRLYGFSKAEFLAMTIKEIRPAEEVPSLLAYLPEMRDVPSLPATQVKHRRKDGSLLEVAGSSSPIEFHGRRARLVLAHDVSETRRIESQARQAQRMEAVGHLAGGVAHDFNNTLGVILGNAELLLRRARARDRGHLEEILKAVDHASGLTRQLLAFGRKQIVDPTVLDLNALVADLEKMFGRLIGEDVDVVIVPGADLGRVRADGGQLEQVVMNLCLNARDAMPDGGVLRIETSNAVAGPGADPGHEAVAPGRYVLLTVSDTGHGIPKDVLPRIFEPFFTTKEVGKGTGLGLAMVYGIVTQAGGHVRMDSELGRGTTARIYLPCIDDPATPLAPPEETALPRGDGTVLVVEDEAPLRAIACELLEDDGYRVIDAAGGRDAMVLASRYPGPIHLLLTDVVMPGMNGRALAEALVGARPGLKVLYMSGYTDDILARNGVLEPGTMLLQKPFTALALLRSVREALAAASVPN